MKIFIRGKRRGEERDRGYREIGKRRQGETGVVRERERKICIGIAEERDIGVEYQREK